MNNRKDNFYKQGDRRSHKDSKREDKVVSLYQREI